MESTLPPKKRRHRRTFGVVEHLPSGRFRARYWGPDGAQYSAKADTGLALTFQTRGDADAWVAMQSAVISKTNFRGIPQPAQFTSTSI
jgi:hypothetical protein